ncbi:hypothetical protein BT69DRAFT_1281363 [Atractiella rhizophila]|nr:hypothetical protein BT69DRAFT_1281363 [Atractiella rhizophila]
MDIPFATEVLLYAYSELSSDVETLLKLSWNLAREAAGLGEVEKLQSIVDNADLAVYNAVDVVARSVLGEYNASAVRLDPDFVLDEISRSRSPLAAVRLFKKSRRSGPHEAVQLWSSIYESNLPPPQRPQFEGPVFDEHGWGLSHLFSSSAVRSALARYPKGKSPGIDGVHARLLAALSCFSSDEEKEKAPSGFYVLADHLSSLFRLVAATQQGKDRPPTAEDSRPLSLFVMFRRLEDPSSWSFTHMAQAGFKRGFSCLSNLLIVDSAVRSHQRPIAIFLDFERAFPSSRGAPPAIRELVWQLCTHNAMATIVVNGERQLPIAIHRGYPQGGPIIPMLFDLFIDPLVCLLNPLLPRSLASPLLASQPSPSSSQSPSPLPPNASSLVSAPSFADDIACIPKTLDTNGMKLNIPKCKAVAPFPQVSSAKYLGMSRGPDGIDFEAWLLEKSDKQDRFLRSLQVVGNGWNELVRLANYRTFVRPISDYGGGLFHYWIVCDERRRSSSPGMLAASQHFKLAVSWIAGVSTDRWKLASSATGLLPPRERFRQLGAGLTAHLRSLSRFNPALPLVTSCHKSRLANCLLAFSMLRPTRRSTVTFSHFRHSFVTNGFAS